ncbi:leucine-zipper-like transcriptional regulator 1 isoform X1 [Protopterus annectens]|uniref:leucine-zipper-like transcriptional regulator 1 isoform X1 n=2 Tax=Protopterus annectens TaxID=7888 RepID=UPI001CFA2A3C|nr:leucine-zipper-like transcriptional regulator 1 isoform X1 [Protopterus annectens]
MALASGQWMTKEVKGDSPSPRHGHALTVAGNIAFVFGGFSTTNSLDDQPKYMNDFYMLTVTPTDLTWEVVPQQGQIPAQREGHVLSIVKGKMYLLGGSADPNAEECLPGIYCFDIGSLTWQKLTSSGVAPRTLKHGAAVVEENIYIFGGIRNGTVVDDLLMFNTVSLTWTPIKTKGSVPAARYGHTLTTVAELIYMFGGWSEESISFKDVYVLDTATFTWQLYEVKGDVPDSRAYHTSTPHHDKDIYVFGGTSDYQDGNITSMNDVTKLSLAKMKWKQPLYVGISPVCRAKHTAFILHSHFYIFGGINEEQEFNDILVMKLINPSDRQPIMKEILSEFGIQGVSHRFSPTKIPKVRYDLSEPPYPPEVESPPPVAVIDDKDFCAVRNQAMDLISRSFTLLNSEFQKLNIEKAAFTQAKIAFQQEKEAYGKQYRKQQQELQEMLEKHRVQNEAWLLARAEENDKERKELCRLREEILHDQEKLKEEQQKIEKRNQQLLSIMQQFKGM